MKVLLPLWAALAMGGPALALEYPCPSDPGFCYFDAANDGCFDGGTDAGPIDGLLESGSFPAPPASPVPGSIVCPPSVGTLKPVAPVDWETAVGGDVLLYRATILTEEGDNVVIDSGGILYLGGLLKLGGQVSPGAGDLALTAVGDVTLQVGAKSAGAASGFADAVVTSTDGDVVLGPKAKLLLGDSTFTTTNGGDVVLGEKVKADFRISSFPAESGRFSASGDLITTDARFVLSEVGTLELQGANVLLGGRTKIKTGKHVDIAASAGGEVRIDALVAAFGGAFTVDAGDVAIGLPDAKGKVRGSKVKADQDEPGQLTIVASGEIELDRVKVTKVGTIDVQTAGTTIRFVEGKVQETPLFPGTTTLSAGPGSTCDVTDSKFKNSTLITNCDTVVGP